MVEPGPGNIGGHLQSADAANLNTASARQLGEKGRESLALVEELGAFKQAYAGIAPHLEMIPREAYGSHRPPDSSPTQTTDRAPVQASDSPSARELIETFTSAASAVAQAWQSLRPGRLAAATNLGRAPADQFEIRPIGNDLHVSAGFGATGEEESWPAIITRDGQEGRAVALSPVTGLEGSRPAALYVFAPPPAAPPDLSQLRFEWKQLQWLERQSASLRARIVRNAELVDGHPSNPAFVSTTEWVSFQGPLVPLLHRGPLSVPAANGLADTVAQIVRPIYRRGAILRVHVSYTHAVDGGSPLRASTAVLFVEMPMNETSTLEDVDKLSRSIARQVGEWYDTHQLSRTAGELQFCLSLFGNINGRQLPLVQIDAVNVAVDMVDPAWWQVP